MAHGTPVTSPGPLQSPWRLAFEATGLSYAERNGSGPPAVHRAAEHPWACASGGNEVGCEALAACDHLCGQRWIIPDHLLHWPI